MKNLLFGIAAVMLATSPAMAQSWSAEGIFCDSVKRIEIFVSEQQKGKTPAEARKMADPNSDVENVVGDHCSFFQVFAYDVQIVSQVGVVLGKNAGIFKLTVGMISTPSGADKKVVKKLDTPIILYTVFPL